MKHIHLLYLCCLFPIGAMAQYVGIGTDVPKATLDLNSPHAATSPTPVGFKLPVLTGEELKSKDDQYEAEQNGTLVYVKSGLPTSERTPKTIAVEQQGVYYYDAPHKRWKMIRVDAETNSLPFESEKLVYRRQQDANQKLQIGTLKFLFGNNRDVTQPNVSVESAIVPSRVLLGFGQYWPGSGRRGHEWVKAAISFSDTKNQQTTHPSASTSGIAIGELNVAYLVETSGEHPYLYRITYYRAMDTNQSRPDYTPNNLYILSSEKF